MVSGIRTTLLLLVALSTSFSAWASDELDRRELVIDGGFTGTLPPPIVLRAGRVWDESLGRLVTTTEPVFDLARCGGVATAWVPESEPVSVATLMMTGWSRDQSSPRMAVYDRQRMELIIWNGDDLADVPAERFSFVRSVGSGVTPDALLGTQWERADVTHRPVSGVMLPGLLLLLLERNQWIDGPLGSEPSITGLSIAALQESTSGEWEFLSVEVVPNDAPPEAADFNRGYVSSMASYYPTSRGSDFTTAFIPFVDYLNHLPDRKAVGGQCGLIRVDRRAVGDAWEIGPAVEVVSSWGEEG